MNQVYEVVQRIVALDAAHSTVLVAIDGCGGAGKTELAARLARSLEVMDQRAKIIHFDDFYLPSALRPAGIVDKQPVGASFDWQRLREQILVPLRAEQIAVYTRYDWATDRLAEQIAVSPGGIIIVEGVGSSRRELAQFYDLRIWVDCPRDVRLHRGMERDGEMSRQRWESDWMPKEDQYVEEHRPHENADIIVSGIVN